MITLESSMYIIAAMILAFIGIYCIVVKRNAIKTIIGIEILTTAINLNFIALGVIKSPLGSIDPLVQSIVIISIVIGACIAAVALMFVIQAYRHYGVIDLKKLRRLRW